MKSALSAAALALVACGSSAPSSVGPSHKAPAPSYEAALDDVLGFLPADSEIVLGIDAAQIRKTAVWTQLGPKVEKLLGGDLADFRTTCGFDPMQTVQRVSVGLHAVDSTRLTGVVVIKGVGANLLGCLRSRYAKAGIGRDDRGVVVITGHQQMAWTMIGATAIVQIGEQVDHDSLQGVLGAGSPLRTSHAFMTLYGELEHGASAWGVVNGKTRLLDEFDSAGMRPTTAIGTLTMSDRIVIAGRAAFRDVDTANKLNAVLAQTLAQIGKFTEHAESRADGSNVVVGLAVSGAQLQMLLGFL